MKSFEGTRRGLADVALRRWFSLFIIHKLAGRFRGEGLRDDNVAPAWQKKMPGLLVSHEPITTRCAVFAVPVFYVVLLGSIILGHLASLHFASTWHAVWAVPALTFDTVAYLGILFFESHHLRSEHRRIQLAACWAWAGMLAYVTVLLPVTTWWIASLFTMPRV